MSRLAIALVFASFVALGACKDTKETPQSPLGKPSSATIQWPDAGAPSIVSGDRTVNLPRLEVTKGIVPAVSQDDSGKRLAYTMANAHQRYVYEVGSNLYIGPQLEGALDFSKAPDRDHVLGVLFENAESRRAQLVADVKHDGNDAAVTKLLIASAYVDGPEWTAAYKQLPPGNAAEVNAALAKLLDTGAASDGLKRAVVLVPLRDPAKVAGLAARVRELVKDLREPRASAVMVRELAAVDRKQGSSVGCDVLAQEPMDERKAKGTPGEADAPGRELLAEAAALAIAADGAECKHLPILFNPDSVCAPYFRCGPSGPLDGRETSKGDEPLCTKDQIVPLFSKELERAPSDVADGKFTPRAALWAYAALLQKGAAPEVVTSAHARRLYALTEPAAPPCIIGSGKLDAPCHCEEAMVRDQSCRNLAGQVHVATCRWDIDDKAKTLSGVVLVNAP